MIAQLVQTDTDAAFRRAAERCRGIGNLELVAEVDARSYRDRDDASVRAARRELARRRRLYAEGRDVPDPDAHDQDAWLELARQVRERTDLLRLFFEGGVFLHHASDAEWRGRCLFCRGLDAQMRVELGLSGGFRCDACGLAGDAIVAAQILLPACRDWYGAVAFLARGVGLALPDERPMLLAHRFRRVRPDLALVRPTSAPTDPTAA